jgi:hypothetical protein
MAIGRRDFIKGATALVPLSMSNFWLKPVLAQGVGAPKRAIFFYIPDGCIPALWHPTGSETNFTLPAMTAPLNAVKNDCVFISGLRMYEGGATHEGGVAKVLTGNNTLSLDVFLAQQLAGQTPVSSVYLGIHGTHENGNVYFSYLPGNKVRTPEDNPLAAFKQLFGNTTTGSGTVTTDPRASVLDNSIAEIQALSTRLGAAERAKLDLHLSALREVERRVKATAPVTGGKLSPSTFNREGFVVPDGFTGYPAVFNREENFQIVGKLQTDLAVLALANDVTRVVSIQWSHPVSPTQMAFTGSTQRHHDASHYGTPDSPTAANFIKLQSYYAGRLADLINKLRAVPEGAGTLLDNTVILLFSELGDSNLHDHSNMPFVVAGRAGGRIRTGRYLSLPEEAHSKLLVSIAQAMGANVNTFGYAGRGTGGLPGLLS